MAGFGNPNAGCEEEVVNDAVELAEETENTELDDDPNVNGELPEPGADSPKEYPVDAEDVLEIDAELPEPRADSPNENPVDRDVLETQVEPKIDDVDA